jgi:hypothetical protein
MVLLSMCYVQRTEETFYATFQEGIEKQAGLYHMGVIFGNQQVDEKSVLLTFRRIKNFG